MKKFFVFLLIIFVIAIILSLLVTFSQRVPLGEKVAVVEVTGMIVDSSNTIDELKNYAKDASVKAIVLRINSPGGAVAPAQEIYSEILKVKEKKKVVASMGAIAASGGYYIAAPTDRIVANAGTLTGSIGVIMELPNVSGLMEKIGIQTQVIKSGRHKDLASVFKELTPQERKILQDVLDDVHEQFIEAVSAGRDMKYEDIKKLADGRIFTGRKALELGLIDELGNMEDAIMVAGRLGGIKGEPEVVTRKEKFSVFDLLKGQLPERIFGNAFSGIELKYLLKF
jgi:protease-4